MISDEIHERRRNSSIGPRGRGVGAEGDSVSGDDISNFKMESDGISSKFTTTRLKEKGRDSSPCLSASGGPQLITWWISTDLRYLCLWWPRMIEHQLSHLQFLVLSCFFWVKGTQTYSEFLPASLKLLFVILGKRDEAWSVAGRQRRPSWRTGTTWTLNWVKRFKLDLIQFPNNMLFGEESLCFHGSTQTLKSSDFHTKFSPSLTLAPPPPTPSLRLKTRRKHGSSLRSRTLRGESTGVSLERNEMECVLCVTLAMNLE